MKQRFFLISTLILLSGLTTSLPAQDTKTEGPAASPADSASAPPWTVLFDGTSMKGWEAAKGYDYEDAGEVEIADGNLVLHGGVLATGVRWTDDFPKGNYEVQLEAQRVDGYDFFAGISFPVGRQNLTLILGGWGGYLTGLSCIDGYRAAENETASSVNFKNKQWYRVRVRVTDKRVTAYVDDERIVNFPTENRKLAVTSEMEPCLPLGIATWGNTTGALRNIRYRKLTLAEIGEGEKK